MAKREKDGNGSNVAVHRGGQALMTSPNERSFTPAPWGEHPLRGCAEKWKLSSIDFSVAGPKPWNPRGTSNDRGDGREEGDNEIVVRAEMPGFEPKDFDIHVSGNMLSIQAEHKEETEGTEKGVHRWERHYGRFQRSIPLSTAVDADKVDARYHSGVLEVHLPRTEPNPRRRIEVKS